ncbi:MAG: FtsX-like permease family protein [Pedosphaera sp.]|nr:FtsX-like permease family protein [Pedosphaera sp.]
MNGLLSFCKAMAARWTWLMAWRDSRRSRRRLLVFSASIVLGIGALTAIGSFGRQSEDAIEAQAKTLLGADLVITSREPFTESQELFLEEIGSGQAREVRFSSMAYFPRTQSTRLVQARALSGLFPFYGEFETEPVSAAQDFRDGKGVLVEESLMTQFGLVAGDRLKLGEVEFPVLGGLKKAPGETLVFATLAPRVYLPIADLERTKLMGAQSLARYRVYYQIGMDEDINLILSRSRTVIEGFRWDYETVERRKEDLGRSMDNLYHFLNLVGFVALMLGGIGIASAMHVHVKQRLGAVAVLRCLGCSSMQALAIYVAQGACLGFVGAVAGAALGVSVQMIVPMVLADFLPMKVEFAIYWASVLQSMAMGFAICLLFALLPLLSVRRVSPLATIRAAWEERPPRDRLVWVCYAMLGCALVAFSISQSRRWQHGLGYAFGLVVACAVLVGIARVLISALRGRVPRALPFAWRQGIANIHRPNNRTVLVMLALGLGTFLILTLQLTERSLVREIIPAEDNSRGNAVLFDIQPDQLEPLKELLRAQNVPVLQDAPVVTMRLAAVKGRAVKDIRKDVKKTVPKWALDREYRSTYRSKPVDSEKVIAGKWHDRNDSDSGSISVSVEEGIARSLAVELGDELTFDVQGVPVVTRVASLREVDWRRLQPNFFIVFPEGSIDEAPAFHVFVLRVKSAEQSAQMQREVVKRFPNISAIDLTMVLKAVESVLGKISFVIRFMALFTVGTGLLVLVASVLTGRYQRLQEATLLRTLGASRGQVLQVLIAEYVALGTLAALTGMILAVTASWALSHFVFKVGFALSPASLIAAVFLVVGMTVLTGILMARGTGNQPPLEILRSEY